MAAAPKNKLPPLLEALGGLGIIGAIAYSLLAPTPKDPQVEAAQMAAVQAGDVAAWISANGADCQRHAEDISTKVYRNGESVEVTSMFHLNGVNLNGLEKPSVEARRFANGRTACYVKKIFETFPKVNEIKTNFTTTLTDIKGKSRVAPVIGITFTRDDANTINWPAIDIDNIPKIADGYWESPVVAVSDH